MQFAHNLYYGEKAKKKKRKLIKSLKKHKFQPDLYVFALPLNEGDCIDIYPAYALLANIESYIDLHIIGLALEKNEMEMLLLSIVKDMYCITNQFDAKTFFKEE